MKKIMFPFLSVALMVGCRFVENGVVVPFNVRSRDKIPAEKIKVVNEKESKLFENKLVTFSSVPTTVFKKCRLFFVCEPRSFNPFYIAVPSGSDVALMLTGNMVFINEIIKNENFKLADTKNAQIKELLKYVFDFNKYGIMYIVNSKNDLIYNAKLEKDIKRKAEVEKRLGEVIKPMSIAREGDKAIVEFYFVDYQDIVKRTVTMNQDGTLDPKSIKDEVVGKGLAPWHRGF